MAAGDLVFNLVARTERLTNGLNVARRQVSGFVKSAMDGFAKFGQAVTGVRSAFELLLGPMQEAQEAALAERKLAQVFKSTANAAGIAKDEVMAYASERQKLTSFDADDTVNAAAILGSFTNIKGNVFTQALTSAQDLSAFMGQDLQTSIMQIGKALNDPAKGVSALAKSGIQFSESQKATIKQLQETGKLAEAQGMILKEMQTQFGGQAEALVNPIDQAKHAWGDFMETIGGIVNEKLLPLMPKLIEAFESLSNVAVGAMEGIDKVGKRMGDWMAAWERFTLIAGGIASGTSPEDLAQTMKEMGLIKSKAELGMVQIKPDQTGKNMMDVMPHTAARNKKRQFEEAAAAAENAKAQQALFDKNRNPAEQMLAGFIRDGLAGLKSGVMSLGPAMVESDDGPANQVGSLEKDSQEAFDVLRANIGPGGQDVQKKQLEELGKITKAVKDLEKKMGRKVGGDEVVKIIGID